MTDNPQPEANALAEAMYPDEWAQMLKLTGRKRANKKRNLRERAKNEVALKALPPHAACGNCDHRGRREGSLICDLDSDFHGYTKVKSDHRCARWKAAA